MMPSEHPHTPATLKHGVRGTPSLPLPVYIRQKKLYLELEVIDVVFLAGFLVWRIRFINH